MRSVIIIPARMESERLPGKPLLRIRGKSLLEWTYNRAVECCPNSTIVATSNQGVIAHCKGIGLSWMDTGEHPTGTHRCAEAAAKLTSQYDVVVNWQVDEPLVKPADVEKLIELTHKSDVCTLVSTMPYKDQQNRDIIKAVVSDQLGFKICQWFSRTPMAGAMGHVGVYAFRWNSLQRISRIKPTILSKAESLEQLAWLENAWEIKAVETDKMPLSINTPEDLDKFREIAYGWVD